MASSTVFLKDEKLRQLAQLIRGQEVNNLYHITFPNLGEQLQYLRMANNNMATVNTILDECNLLREKYKADGVRGPIADQVLDYAEHCLNNALQLIRNYTMRSDYLDKMMDHHQQLFQALEDLDPSNRNAAAELTETIREYDELVMNFMRLNLNSHASAEFSRYLRNVGIGFNELVRSYQTKLGYPGRFEDLEEEQKLEVYAAIIEESGRLSVLAKHEGDVVEASSITYRKKKPSLGSAAMFLIDVGLIIWDLYSSDHTITTATRQALVLAAEAGGAALGKLVGVAVATQLTGQAATTLFVTAVGLVGGFVGAFILGAVARVLFNLIFGSGGERPLPTDGFIVYVAPMPNGHDIAKQIA
ncbi:hypothetical protein OROMI_028941 [Orobanche minor]